MILGINYYYIFSLEMRRVMPLVDLPFEQLQTYKGISPCPEDLDLFWDESLKELDRYNWEIRLEQSDFQAPYADCFDLFFTGYGNVKVHAKFLRPKCIESVCPAIIQFHGYKGASGDWSDMLKYVAAGFSVASLDCRGQGGKSRDKIDVAGSTLQGHLIRGLEDGRDHLMFRYIFMDTVQLAKIMMSFSEIDENRIGVTGSSQGGGLAIACASLEPRIKYAAPIFPFLSDYKRVWNMDCNMGAYEELRTYFRQFDPHHNREAEIFYMLGYIDIKNLASRIKGKVFMGLTLMDEICPPSTQFAVYNNITCEKQHVIYYDYGHEDLPGIQDGIFSFFMEMRDIS
jgi:cephalosporin-C deacetylase